MSRKWHKKIDGGMDCVYFLTVKDPHQHRCECNFWEASQNPKQIGRCICTASFACCLPVLINATHIIIHPLLRVCSATNLHRTGRKVGDRTNPYWWTRIDDSGTGVNKILPVDALICHKVVYDKNCCKLCVFISFLISRLLYIPAPCMSYIIRHHVVVSSLYWKTYVIFNK